MVSPRQSLGTFSAQRLWQLNLQSKKGQRTIRLHVIWLAKHEVHCVRADRLTLALKALAEQAAEEPLAVLTHRRPRVGVHGERVRHLHFAHQELVQMNRSPRVKAPRITCGPWLGEQMRIKDNCGSYYKKNMIVRLCHHCFNQTHN